MQINISISLYTVDLSITETYFYQNVGDLLFISIFNGKYPSCSTYEHVSTEALEGKETGDSDSDSEIFI